MTAYVVIDPAQLKAALDVLDSYTGLEMAKRLRKATLAGAMSLREPIRNATPVIHGREPNDGYQHDLAGSVSVRAVRDDGKWIGYRTGPRGKKGWFAAMVVGGTKPHTIRGKVGEALGLPFGPKAFVHHPGARPNPYIERVEQAQEGRVIDAMVRSIVRQRDKAGF